MSLNGSLWSTPTQWVGVGRWPVVRNPLSAVQRGDGVTLTTPDFEAVQS